MKNPEAISRMSCFPDDLISPSGYLGVALDQKLDSLSGERCLNEDWSAFLSW